jgi:hypothetical protein
MFDFGARVATTAKDGRWAILPTRQLPKVEHSEYQLLNIWQHAIALFTTANLTYTSDKLSATSVIARKMAEYSRDDYLAGMWRKDLLLQLPWFAISPPQFKRPTGYRAPTWSWASIDCEAELTIPKNPTVFAEVQDAHVTSLLMTHS